MGEFEGGAGWGVEERADVSLMNLGKKFRTMCCGEDGDICVHFGKVAHLHEELPVLGCTASDDECATPLMGSLL